MEENLNFLLSQYLLESCWENDGGSLLGEKSLRDLESSCKP